MKKILICMLSLMMLNGCMHKEKHNYTFMLENEKKLNALYNQDAKKLTEYKYKTFKEVEGLGYIVTNQKNQKGFITLKGEEVVKLGTYEKIDAVDHMLYAKKKQKTSQSKDKSYIKDNLYILNGEGELLYSASQDTQILISDLPIVFKNKEYIVLNHDGSELYKGKNRVYYASYLHDDTYALNFGDKVVFYGYSQENEKDIKLDIPVKGNYKIMLSANDHAVLYDAMKKQMIYIDMIQGDYKQHAITLTDFQCDDAGNIILYNGNQTYIYVQNKGPVLLTSFYKNSMAYVERSKDIYGPHKIIKNFKEVASIENCQFYPKPLLIKSDIFPVYDREKGYTYYNFDGKKVIDQYFLFAEPFNEYQTAIVKISEDHYALIDDKGDILTKKEYNRIKYIGSSYYAVYNDSDLFGIVDSEGKEVLGLEYTTLPDNAVIEHYENKYMMLGKNGRTYLYDLNNDMKVILDYEGSMKYNPKGYLITDQGYYMLDGTHIE